MNINLPLDDNKKLSIIFRVEPGCLGPNGDDYIYEFCQFAQKEIEKINSDLIVWEIVPRHNKLLDEIEYKIKNKTLSKDMTERYLNLFEHTLDEIENNLDEKIGQLIDQYMGRK